MADLLQRIAGRKQVRDGGVSVQLVAQVNDLAAAVLAQAMTIRLQEAELRDLRGRVAGLETEFGCAAVSDWTPDDARDDALTAAREGGVR